MDKIVGSALYLIFCAFLFAAIASFDVQLALFIMVPMAIMGISRILLGAGGLMTLIVIVIAFLVVCFIAAVICAPSLGFIVSVLEITCSDKTAMTALFIICPIVAIPIAIFLTLLSLKYRLSPLGTIMFSGLFVWLLLAIINIEPTIGMFAALKWFVVMTISIVISLVIVSYVGGNSPSEPL